MMHNWIICTIFAPIIKWVTKLENMKETFDTIDHQNNDTADANLRDAVGMIDEKDTWRWSSIKHTCVNAEHLRNEVLFYCTKDKALAKYSNWGARPP